MITIYKIDPDTQIPDKDIIYIDRGNINIEIIPWNKLTKDHPNYKDKKTYKKISMYIEPGPQNLINFSRLINQSSVLSIIDSNEELQTVGLVFKKLYFNAKILDREDIAVDMINVVGDFEDLKIINMIENKNI